MNISELRQYIRSSRESGETYRKIAGKLGIKSALVKYIENNSNYRPGKKVAAILNLDPEPGLISTRKRRERLDEIARSWGYSSWCAYETECIKPREIQPWVNEAVGNLIQLREKKINS